MQGSTRFGTLSPLATLLALWAFSRAGTGSPSQFALLAMAAFVSVAFAPAVWARNGSKLLADERFGVALVMLTAFSIAYLLFGSPFDWGDIGVKGDWPVNEAFIREEYGALVRGTALDWSMVVAPGEPSRDLYPTLIHRVLAWIAWLFSGSASIHLLMVGTGITAYVLVAIGLGRTALRLGAPAAAAALLTVLGLVDRGSDYSWGIIPVFRWGFFPSTVALAICFNTLPSYLDALRSAARGPRLRAAIGFGLAACFHPMGLVFAGCLLAVTVLPVRRRGFALDAMLTVALALACTAFVWMPNAAEVVAYGVHYGTPEIPVGLALEHIMTGQLPDGGFGTVVTVGWLGGLALFSRKRSPSTFVAALAILFVALYLEPFFLDLGLAPTTTSVRWQSYRGGTVIKPLVYALTAVALGAPRDLVVTVRSRALRVAFGVAALGGLAWTYNAYADGIATEWTAIEQRLHVEIRGRERHGDTSDDVALWLRARIEEMHESGAPETGDGIARTMVYCTYDCPFDLLALASEHDVPMVLHHPSPAGIFLRDQFFTVTDENLHRFGVRWIVHFIDSEQPPVQSHEVARFGVLAINEVPGWDGTFAHVESGDGVVHTLHAASDGLVLRVDGSEPVLVDLGMPYWARLVARHESGRTFDIYARPVPRPAGQASSERTVHVWLPPGTTTIRANGPLPSDWPGRIVSLAVIGFVYARRRLTRVREFVRSVIDRLARPYVTPTLVVVGAAFVVFGLVIKSGQWTGVATGLRFGVLFPRPTVTLVEGSADGEHESPCEMRSLGREFACPGGVHVLMSIAQTVREWHVGWFVPVPAVSVHGPRGSRVRLRFPATLEGAYYGSCRNCTADLEAGTNVSHFTTATQRMEVDRSEGSTLTLRTSGEAAFSVLRAEFLDPPTIAPEPPSTPPF